MFYYPIVMVHGFAKERIVCYDEESPADKKERFLSSSKRFPERPSH